MTRAAMAAEIIGLSCRLTLITLPALWKLEMLSLIRFSQAHSCDLRKTHGKCITMVMLFSFFENCFSCKDKRPVGEDFPWQLRHDIWCDSDWHRALPEAGYTCGPGEADDLHVHGTTPLPPFFLSYSVCWRSHTAGGTSRYKIDLAFIGEREGLPEVWD